jgi:hypothetical protein
VVGFRRLLAMVLGVAMPLGFRVPTLLFRRRAPAQQNATSRDAAHQYDGRNGSLLFVRNSHVL